MILIWLLFGRRTLDQNIPSRRRGGAKSMRTRRTDFSFPVILQVLHDFVQQIIQKLVGILMHRASEEDVLLLQLGDEGLWSDDALAIWVMGDMVEEGSKSGV